MAFGGSGFSFGGNNNNNNQTTGFGGFGSSNNNAGGFGASSNTGFGATSTNSNPFGGGSSAFGASTGGFGSTANNGTTSLFGNASKPAASPFGGTSTTSLFGSGNNSASTGGFGGGFGANTNTSSNATSAFGGTSGGGAFSFGGNSNKPAFGASNTSTTTPLFGQGGSGTTGGFGSVAGAFGSSGTALNQPVPPCEGTGSTPFAPTVEKEQSGATNSFQTITFQQPYSKYSLEELRLADYNGGRRFGNGSGPTTGFGGSSFGGFGANNSTTTTGNSLFGNTNNNSNPFGAATTNAGGFGSTAAAGGFGNSGSSLFGNNANKPASLFGAATTASGTTSLFGTANNNSTTTGGFGTGTTGGFGNNNSTGSSLFGNNAAKPATSLFGNAGAGTTTGNAFGFGNNNQSSSLSGTTLFGSNNSTTNTGGSLFGNNTTTNTGGTMFGNNATQNKPGGLFGGTGGFGAPTTQAQSGTSLFGASNTTGNTGGGLFANNNNTSGNTGSLFGNNTNNNTTGGGGLFGNNNSTAQTGSSLFGNNQNKPGGMFGNTGTTGGGLFGNNNATANNNSGSLFGNNNGGGLFANSANKPTTSLFGTTNNNQQGSSLFGNNNSGGMFGNSASAQQGIQQQDQFKVSSLLDPNPYGQSSIWTGLPAPTPENTKPVFTPLTATQKMKESMLKPPPSLKLNQSRYMTPPRRNGFGLSYSTYGTPNSAASTPGGAGLSGSMYGSRGWSGGSFGRSFSKSASVQNLRAQYSSDGDDIWKPGAFSAHRNSSGSIKRLTIDRTIRNDLFTRPVQPALPAPEKPASNGINGDFTAPQKAAEPQHDASNKLKKRVSFDNNTTSGELNGQTGALVRTETDDDDKPSEPVQESRPSSGASSSSRSKELAAVPEDRESDHVSTRPAPSAQDRSDPEPGDYWMKPSRAELAKLSREKLQRFKDFQVGRQGCGYVTFNGTVDLTALNLDNLFDDTIVIRIRSITVYPDTATKPPVGKGLNVPSTLCIENSWPRSRNKISTVTSGPVMDKHIERLKKIHDTDFVNYEATSGVWTFRVSHYTRYGLDYDDDDENMSQLSAPPDTIERPSHDQSAMDTDHDESLPSEDDDDTFAFRQKTVPGGFGRQPVIDRDSELQSDPVSGNNDNGSERSEYSEDELSEDEPSMAGSFPNGQASAFESPSKPILRAPGTPGRTLLDLDGDWADQLQRTISPRKQNRDVLRDAQSKVLLDRAYSPIKPSAVSQEPFRTSVDVMASIFGGGVADRRTRSGRSVQSKDNVDFEFPYAKRAKTFDSNLDDLSGDDKRWHESMRARFTETGDFIVKKRRLATGDEVLVQEGAEAITKVEIAGPAEPLNLTALLSSSKVTHQQGIPFIHHLDLPFSFLRDQLTKHATPNSNFRSASFVYTLAHILFDDYDDKYTSKIPATERPQLTKLIVRDRLSDFISRYIQQVHGDHIANLERQNPVAGTILRLTHHDIKGACDNLQKSGNYRLMTLVAQLGAAGKIWQDDVRAQINAWRDQGLLSEMNDDIRALYEICAGNVSICLGRSANGTAVEDRAKTFSISEEYGLDWLQAFALGLWYGRDEKDAAYGKTRDGVVAVEIAVKEFADRCERGEENERPDDDPMWALLRLYAAGRGTIIGDQVPVFPQCLEEMNAQWDATEAFKFHHAVAAHVKNATIDSNKADELACQLGWQLSSQGDIAGATASLLHIADPLQRQLAVEDLLQKFVAHIPDPPATSGSTTDTKGSTSDTPNLWTTLATRLQIPTSWLYACKALYTRTTNPSNPHLELTYIIAAQAWNVAHDCLLRRVAPSCIIDEDFQGLSDALALFGDDVEKKIPDWGLGQGEDAGRGCGAVYEEFLRFVALSDKIQSSGAAGNQAEELEVKVLVERLGIRLTGMQKGFERRGQKDQGSGQVGNGREATFSLGRLSREELEERVAVREMARIVAEVYDGSVGELPVTTDRRLVDVIDVAGAYFGSVMAQGVA